jgi:hypothetical protein
MVMNVHKNDNSRRKRKNDDVEERRRRCAGRTNKVYMFSATDGLSSNM